MKIQRDAFVSTVLSTTHLISPADGSFCSTHIKIVATDKHVRSFCANDYISAGAYVPCEAPAKGTFYFQRAALEAFATKLTAEFVEITKIGNRNILRADARVLEFLDPLSPQKFPAKPSSVMENLDILSEADALTIQLVAQSATNSRDLPQFNCVYAVPVDKGTEIYAYNGLSVAMGVLDKKFKRPVALPVSLARMAKFGNLLVSDTEVGIDGSYCLYWCKAPVQAQSSFPLSKIQQRLNMEGNLIFEIDGEDMTNAVDLLDRAFKSSDENDDTQLILGNNKLMVRVKFSTTKFEEVLDVRGQGIQKLVLKLPLKDHARLLPALARQPVLRVYNVGKHVRFEGDGFKLLLPLEA